MPQKNSKSTRPDKINAGILKLVAEKDGKDLNLLTTVFSYINKLTKIITDLLKSTFINFLLTFYD